MTQNLKILCWNCRGASSGEFLREMKDFRKRFNPAVIILMEPKISDTTADAVCRKLGKNQWIRSEAEGFCGGVWCLWDDEEIEIKLKCGHNFFLHVTVKSL